MTKKNGWMALVTFMAVIICGSAASPAHAFQWFWQKKAAPSVSQPNPAPTAAAPAIATPVTQASASIPTSSKPVAAAPPANSDPKTVATSKIYGIVESVDAARERLNLKTSTGKTESFTLTPSSMIFEHHQKLLLSSLKIGEHVSVHYHAGSNEASRVYVLGEKKA